MYGHIEKDRQIQAFPKALTKVLLFQKYGADASFKGPQGLSRPLVEPRKMSATQPYLRSRCSIRLASGLRMANWDQCDRSGMIFRCARTPLAPCRKQEADYSADFQAL
jgi:hypothetical protein